MIPEAPALTVLVINEFATATRSPLARFARVAVL